MTSPKPLITGTDFITVATKDFDADGELERLAARRCLESGSVLYVHNAYN